MNQNELFTRTNQEARIHDLANYSLYTDTPGKPNSRARLYFGERNGNPRVTVMTGLDTQPKVIGIGMDPSTFEFFLNTFESICKNSASQKRKIDNLIAEQQPAPGQSYDSVKKAVKNTIHYGKDSEGICWIGVEQNGVPNFVFKILPSSWHNFYGTDGEVCSKEQMSSIYAVAMIGSIRRAMDRWTSRVRPYVDFRKDKEGTGKKVENSYVEDDQPF